MGGLIMFENKTEEQAKKSIQIFCEENLQGEE